MDQHSNIKRILITGPESTGKTSLAKALAHAANEPWVPEYAVEYLQKHGPNYQLDDLLHIAKGQFALEDQLAGMARKQLFCDTGPLVLKIWAEYKFGQCPPFIQKAWEERVYDQIILLPPNIPWQDGPFRENPADRDVLFELYQQALLDSGKTFEIYSHD
ncbi:MAG: ATP-binding protein [Bacteroidetes bacterium]|nr:ATP-binding protein [Bacteroidota bacterium]